MKILYQDNYVWIAQHYTYVEMVWTMRAEEMSYELFINIGEKVFEILDKHHPKYLLIDKRMVEEFFRDDHLLIIKCMQWYDVNIVRIKEYTKKVATVLCDNSIVRPAIATGYTNEITEYKFFDSREQAYYWLSDNPKSILFKIGFWEKWLTQSISAQIVKWLVYITLIIYFSINIYKQNLFSEIYDCQKEVERLHEIIKILRK